VLGKPKAQYGALTWITAKRRQAMLVAIVPSAIDAGEDSAGHVGRVESQQDIHKRYIAGTHPTSSPTTSVIARPAMDVGMSLIIVSNGV